MLLFVFLDVWVVLPKEQFLLVKTVMLFLFMRCAFLLVFLRRMLYAFHSNSFVNERAGKKTEVFEMHAFIKE